MLSSVFTSVVTFVYISIAFGSKQLFSPGCIVLCGAVSFQRQRKRCSVQHICDNVASYEHVIASGSPHSFTDASLSNDAIATDLAYHGESPGCGVDFESWG